MYKVGTEIKVGLFVLAALATLVWMTFRLGGFQSYKEQTYNVDAVFTEASGLKIGVAVQVAGINVGRVDDISLYNDQARVVMAIRKGVNLPIDSRAFIRTQGVLGDKYIELSPGQNTERNLADGDHITETQNAADLSELLEKLGSVADDLKSLTQSLTADGGGEDLRAIVTNVKQLSENLNNLVKDNGPGVSETLASLGRTADNLERITTQISSGKGTLGGLVNDDSVLIELRTALHGIREITDKISSGQGTIGRLVNDETTIDKIDKALTGISEYLDKEEEMTVGLDIRADYMTQYDYLKTTANIKLQTRPDRWYLLGVTSDYFGRYSRTDYYSGANRWERDNFERGKLKFNAMIAQRYYDFVIRGGVIESGAGLGVDWYLFNDDLRITFEAFSGDFDHNPHLRVMANYRFWKFLYFGGGYDDFISDSHRASPFISFGLFFTDDDLKYLLSGAGSLIK
ncbi:MAG: MCE family protein [Deltaproteobacteria bacterium]|jgi:phospholipid/cholesterol/gamma-HCH transport system substrate-binding protein|nr:MCE family protein [Deltaproteobacteria bacterium]